MSTKFAEAYLHLRGDDRDLERDLNRTRGRLGSWLADVSSMMTGTLAASGIASVFDGIKDAIAGMVTGNAQFEQFQTSFEVLLGSAERARAMLQDLSRFAATTPFELPGLIKASQQLLAFGVAGDDVLPMLRSIGDAAAASPDGMEQAVGRITRAIGQMLAKGKITAEEMMQLTEAGVPAWQLLADQMGKSVADVMAEAQRGTLVADQAITTLLAGMDKKYGGMMAKQSQTFGGLWSTMKDNAAAALREIGGPLFDALKNSMAGLGDAMASPDFRAGIEVMRNMVAGVVDVFRYVSAGAVTAFSVVRDIATSTAATVSELWSLWGDDITNILMNFGETYFAVLNGAVSVAQQVAQFIGDSFRELFGVTFRDALTGALENLRVFSNDWSATWEYLKTAAALRIVQIMDFFAGAWDHVKATAVATLEGIVALFGWVGDSWRQLLQNMLDLNSVVFRAIAAGMEQLLAGNFSSIHTAMLDTVGDTLRDSMRLIGDAGATFSDAFGKSWDASAPEFADSELTKALQGSLDQQFAAMRDAADRVADERRRLADTVTSVVQDPAIANPIADVRNTIAPAARPAKQPAGDPDAITNAVERGTKNGMEKFDLTSFADHIQLAIGGKDDHQKRTARAVEKMANDGVKIKNLPSQQPAVVARG